jgi:pilus assembly protein CpaF
MLERAGMFDSATKERLRRYVKDSKTIIIAGKGGSGKTTLLGALINEVPLSQRCILIQETMEIMPKHPDIIVQLVRISDNPEIKSYTLFDLTKHALLMSLDRIFIGEMKDREAFDFFNAVYTGHRGSMATLHANSAGEVVNRLLQLMSRANVDLREETLRDMLYSSLDAVIFLENFKVKEIMEISKE